MAVSTGAGIRLLDHEVRLLDSDQTVNLQKTYAGKVILIVNTASQCLFTRQYAGLEGLYTENRERGLVVLGFPSNDFGEQEPGAEAQIQAFCRLNYPVQFPLFAKTHVRKGIAAPLFQGLAGAAGRYPKWNFHKYLLDRQGRLAADFLSWTSPRGRTLRRAIERLL